MLENSKGLTTAETIGLTLETVAGDIIQEHGTGKTAKVMYFGNFLNTDNTVLLVSPTEFTEDESLTVVLHGVILPPAAFQDTTGTATQKIIHASFGIKHTEDMSKAIDLVIAELAAEYYALEVFRISSELAEID